RAPGRAPARRRRAARASGRAAERRRRRAVAGRGAAAAVCGRRARECRASGRPEPHRRHRAAPDPGRTRPTRARCDRVPNLVPSKVLVTGASGFVGAALIPRLTRDGHDVRAFGRAAGRVRAHVPVVEGDAVTGAGLDAALEGVECAYFLIHSMETAGTASGGDFAERDRRAARAFADAARVAGVRRVVYLGGLVPADAPPSPHLASRLEVERILLDAAPEGVAFRASIVIAAASRSFRFLVRLVERLPVLALPGWREHRTQPIDGRDVLEFLAAAAALDAGHAVRSWDIAGPDAMTYEELIDGIADAMVVDRPKLG